MYDGGWQAKIEKSLVRRIRNKLCNMDLEVVQRMISMIRRKLRKISITAPLFGNDGSRELVSDSLFIIVSIIFCDIRAIALMNFHLQTEAQMEQSHFALL